MVNICRNYLFEGKNGHTVETKVNISHEFCSVGFII